MTEQLLATNTLQSRLHRNGKNSLSSKNFTSQLTEENLKLHTTMGPSARETKTHLVLVYVDLQKQLVALEEQMRIEAKAAQEKFTMSLPKDTPSVIPEIIQIPISKPNPTSLPSPPPIEENDLSEPYDLNSTSPPLKKLIKNMKSTHRIKSLFKNQTKKTFNSADNLSPTSFTSSRTSYFERDNTSLNVEPSIHPTCSQSSQRSKSLKRSKTPLKRIFIPPPTYNRSNSAETLNTLTHNNNSTSSPHNNLACSNTRHSSAPSTPFFPNCTAHLNNDLRLDTTSATNNERCENLMLEYRDSGIALVSPGGKSNHSREHSFSTLLRKIDLFNAFNHQNGEKKVQRVKSRGSVHSAFTKSKENEHELLAFRYPSLKDIDDMRYSTGNLCNRIFDHDDSIGIRNDMRSL
ncbi:3888_t:CDS:2 [Cetraspora pellucida]|uniref:3888_t:CDS:1 n=1 Tax=Cetraspora pellucida TaxID=1433469 RepID=A0ACA9KUU2_9GLOM|nr:3888_t:CDS:2 [Cetraspora pellucida]